MNVPHYPVEAKTMKMQVLTALTLVVLSTTLVPVTAEEKPFRDPGINARKDCPVWDAKRTNQVGDVKIDADPRIEWNQDRVRFDADGNGDFRAMPNIETL